MDMDRIEVITSVERRRRWSAAEKGPNARVYTDPARNHDKHKAIEKIANVTAHVPRRPLRLSPLLKGAERAT